MNISVNAFIGDSYTYVYRNNRPVIIRHIFSSVPTNVMSYNLSSFSSVPYITRTRGSNGFSSSFGLLLSSIYRIGNSSDQAVFPIATIVLF